MGAEEGGAEREVVGEESLSVFWDVCTAKRPVSHLSEASPSSSRPLLPAFSPCVSTVDYTQIYWYWTLNLHFYNLNGLQGRPSSSASDTTNSPASSEAAEDKMTAQQDAVAGNYYWLMSETGEMGDCEREGWNL